MDAIIEQLAGSDEAAIRYKIAAHVLNCDERDLAPYQQAVKDSPLVEALLAERDTDGKIPYSAYAKWHGAHWVLATLADIGYPANDNSLKPLAGQVYNWLFSDKHVGKISRLTLDGRVRMCASMEGNAIYYLLALGLVDDRVNDLAQRLLNWQWPDGGWNCDKHHEAQNSSFMETLLPMRGLALYAKVTGHAQARVVAEQAAEIFLKRCLFKRQRDGEIIRDDFVRLHYPCYWHYDILFGLKVLAEAGLIGDSRCNDAFDLLESKRLPDGGFPAEKRYYRVTDKLVSGRSLVDWGGTSKRRMNAFVTADALAAFKAAGR